MRQQFKYYLFALLSPIWFGEVKSISAAEAPFISIAISPKTPVFQIQWERDQGVTGKSFLGDQEELIKEDGYITPVVVVQGEVTLLQFFFKGIVASLDRDELSQQGRELKEEIESSGVDAIIQSIVLRPNFSLLIKTVPGLWLGFETNASPEDVDLESFSPLRFVVRAFVGGFGGELLFDIPNPGRFSTEDVIVSTVRVRFYLAKIYLL